MNNFTITFKGFDLTSIPYVNFSRRFPDEMPEKQINTATLARRHGQKVISAFFSKKTILLEGYIDAPDRAAMEAARDTLMYRLLPQESNLDLVQAGLSRTYLVTVQNFAWTHIEGGKALFSIEFLASDPFGKDTSATALSFSNPRTEANYDHAITIGGSFDAEIVLTVIVTSGTGLTTNKVITITNLATGEAISVTNDWTAGDVLVIDVPNRQVTVNNTVIDYSGVFPLFAPGVQLLRYSDTFTTRSVSLSGSYYKRYL